MILSNNRLLKLSLLEFDKDDYYEILSKSINKENDRNRFKSMCKEAIKYHKLFNDEFFIKELPKNNPNDYGPENILSFVLPFIRRIYSEFFINPPTLFKEDRLELFKSSLNIEEVVIFFIDKIKNNINILRNFKNIDIYPTLIGIICDDYVSMKISEVQSNTNIKSTLRDLKIKNGLGIK